MIYTGIYDAKLIYEEAQEATLSAGRLPLNVAAQAQAIQGGFSDALTAARIERCRQAYRFRAIRIRYILESSVAR